MEVLGEQIGGILRQLCRQKGIELLEGNALPDHLHLLLSVPPKYSIAMTVGYLKGKSAVRIHRELMTNERNLVWASVLVTRILREHGGIG